MLTLNDGRSELWQWDTGRTLAVDADCSQVHFSNKVFGRSIDVDVVDGAAIIPDILLQADRDLSVWAFVGTSENGYTKISKTFKVNRRNKPADYVFTQTDQITLQTIQRQIGDLADLTTEAKDTLVAAINEAARTGGGAGSMDLRVAGGYVQYSRDGGMTWTNLIAMEDLKGDPGAPGADGKSAYQYAQDGGYTGTEAEFAAKLAQDIPTVDSTLTQSGQAADAAVVGNRLSALSEEIANLPSGGTGLTSAEKTAMLTLFKAAAYTANVSGTITSLETLWGGGGESGGGESGGGETGTTYSVTNNLTNVTSSNSATTASGYYSATLSAEDGYTISVTITMGGVDITDSVYTEDGTILITEVTGDIVITAAAELATAPVLYQLANTPVTVNADLYEDTGLAFGSESANGYTKAWTMVAKVKNMTAGYLWCVAGQANLSAKYENRWNDGAGNNVAHLTTTICATVNRPSITQANPDAISIVITKEALSVKTATLYYLNYAGELQTSELVGTYGNFYNSVYAGNMMVGGQSAADFVGTIEEFTIYEGVATEEQIKSYLGVA